MGKANPSQSLLHTFQLSLTKRIAISSWSICHRVRLESSPERGRGGAKQPRRSAGVGLFIFFSLAFPSLVALRYRAGSSLYVGSTLGLVMPRHLDFRMS